LWLFQFFLFLPCWPWMISSLIYSPPFSL
jgi:hypothetical protein